MRKEMLHFHPITVLIFGLHEINTSQDTFPKFQYTVTHFLQYKEIQNIID